VMFSRGVPHVETSAQTGSPRLIFAMSPAHDAGDRSRGMLTFPTPATWHEEANGKSLARFAKQVGNAGTLRWEPAPSQTSRAALSSSHARSFGGEPWKHRPAADSAVPQYLNTAVPQSTSCPGSSPHSQSGALGLQSPSAPASPNPTRRKITETFRRNTSHDMIGALRV
jgi:hypothetical protein